MVVLVVRRKESLQAFLEPRQLVFARKLTFPDSENAESNPAQLPQFLSISLDISRELFIPECAIPFRCRTSCASPMTMPEASVHVDGALGGKLRNIG
jgi:hypothetical protein